MLRTIVCDDEQPALDLLTQLLEETGSVSVLAACRSVEDALEIVNQEDVDLVVFDIEMPEINGVDAYGQITKEPRPLVIFATAHPEYAVDAFGVEAIDYILKPFTRKRVEAAVEKAIRLQGLISERERGTVLQSPKMASQDRHDAIKIKDAGKVHFVPHSDIIWIEAAGDYSLLHLSGRELAVRIPMKTLEGEFPSMFFTRVHRSAIVSNMHIREIDLLPKGEALITLENGNTVRTSRSYRDAVRTL